MRAETIETLRLSQRFGFLGARPVEEAAEHAMGFAAALGELPSGARLIDLGSGGGLPGLVLADAYPDCSIVLVDRRQKRTDFLARAASRLGHGNVDVRCADAARVAASVEQGHEQPFDAVTARGFGPPEVTLRLARRLVADGGRIVISEPPEGERWDPELLAELGLDGERVGSVRRFQARRTGA
jgi:16S rRNA (guanine527-N7)-methyltransferase